MISVTFRKSVSDGAYGTEMAESNVSFDIDPDDGDYRLRVAALLSTAREQVTSELRQSPSMAVRRALVRQDPPAPRPAPDDEDQPF